MLGGLRILWEMQVSLIREIFCYTKGVGDVLGVKRGLGMQSVLNELARI